MTEEQDEARDPDQDADAKSAREKVSSGIRDGLGMLSAFKDALEETLQEARDRGDLSADKAKEVMKDALGKAQNAAGDARDRLDLVSQKEFDGLSAVVDSIRDRVSALEEHFRPAADGEGDPSGGEGAPDDEAAASSASENADA